MKVGVLAIQGDFTAHGRALARVGAEPVLVRKPADFTVLDALVLRPLGPAIGHRLALLGL